MVLSRIDIPTVNNVKRNSIYISEEANELIRTSLPKGCKPLSLGMVKRYTHEHQQNECTLREIGVLCFLKDEARGYYFQLFCPVRKQVVWEHHMNASMDYKAQTSQYHSFSCGPNKEIVTGFKFSSEKESEAFLKEVLKILNELKTIELQQKQIEEVSNLSRRVPISKSEIGLPYNFRKVSGYRDCIGERDSNSSFNRIKSTYQNVSTPPQRMTEINSGSNMTQHKESKIHQNDPIPPGSSNGPEKDFKSNFLQLKSKYQNVPPPPRVTEKNLQMSSTEIKRTKSLHQTAQSLSNNYPKVSVRNSLSDFSELEQFRTKNQNVPFPPIAPEGSNKFSPRNAATLQKILPSVPVRSSSVSHLVEIVQNKTNHHNVPNPSSRSLEEPKKSSHQKDVTPPKPLPRAVDKDLESNLGFTKSNEILKRESFKIRWDSKHGIIDSDDIDLYRKIKEYFLKAGLPENHLLDSGIRQFIQHFLITNIEKFIKEMGKEGSIEKQEQVPLDNMKINKPKINVDEELHEVAEYKVHVCEYNNIEQMSDSSNSLSYDDSGSDDEIKLILNNNEADLIQSSKDLNQESNIDIIDNIDIETEHLENFILKQENQSPLKNDEIKNSETVEAPIMHSQSVTKSEEITSNRSTVHVEQLSNVSYKGARKTNFFKESWLKNKEETRLASSNFNINSTFYDTDTTPMNMQIKQSQSMSSIAESGVTESHNEMKSTYQETKHTKTFASHHVNLRELTKIFHRRGSKPLVRKEVFSPDDPVLLSTRGNNVSNTEEEEASLPPPFPQKGIKNKKKAPPPPPK